MQYVIPDVPSELKTQMQREALLAKEAKYEHGLKKQDFDYEELMNYTREGGNSVMQNSKTPGRSHFAYSSRFRAKMDSH